MTTPNSPISLSQVNSELEYASTQTISLNDTYVKNLAGGNRDMNSLRNKSSTTIPSQQSGANFQTIYSYDVYGNVTGATTAPEYGWTAAGCTAGGTYYSPSWPYTYAVTSNCARPQLINITYSFIFGNNNYGQYGVRRSDNTLMSITGYYDQLSYVRGQGVQPQYVGFQDWLPAYSTTYYAMFENVGGRGDYCYSWGLGADGFGPMYFSYANQLG